MTIGSTERAQAHAATAVGGVRGWWGRSRGIVLTVATLVMVVAAVQRLADALGCYARAGRCAIDIGRFHGRLWAWFAGDPVYQFSTLPPASYPLLWPFLGWLPRGPALWLWVVTGLAGVAWLSLIVSRGNAAGRAERVFLAVTPWAAYALRATLVAGQFILHILAPLLSGVLLLHRRPASWGRDLVVAALLLWALVKPSVAAPFVLLVALGGPLRERVRPTALIVLGYAFLTLVAAAFREGGLVQLGRNWVDAAVVQAAGNYGRTGAYGSVHHWLAAAGQERWNAVASLVALAWLGVWIHRRRGTDPWILLGVTALVARLWTYHRIYDDLLLIPALVALYRLATRRAGGDPWAVLLFVVSWAGAVAPARLFFLPAPWGTLYAEAVSLTWLATLAFLAYRARTVTSPPTRVRAGS